MNTLAVSHEDARTARLAQIVSEMERDAYMRADDLAGLLDPFELVMAVAKALVANPKDDSEVGRAIRAYVREVAEQQITHRAKSRLLFEESITEFANDSVRAIYAVQQYQIVGRLGSVGR